MSVERQVLFWSVLLVLAVILLGLLRDVLLPFVLGTMLAYMLNPLVNLTTRSGLPRTAAAALVLLGGIVLIAFTMVTVVPLVLDQLQKFALRLPDLIAQLRGVVDDVARARLGPRYPEFAAHIDKGINALTDNWAAIASTAANSLLAQMRSLVNLVSLVLVTPLVAFYVLVDWEPMLARIDGWLPRQHEPAIRRLAVEINDAISAFIRGQGMVCLILAVFYAASLQAIGLEYGLLVGLATGISSFVPFVGWAIGFISAMALALAQFWPAMMPVLLVAGVFIAGQVLDAAFLSPRIVGSRIGLHPVWLLFALVAFSSLFGFVGVLVAVPIAAAIAVLVRFALAAYLDSELYKGSSRS
jgi:predicted PurR-regulated permease PerM